MELAAAVVAQSARLLGELDIIMVLREVVVHLTHKQTLLAGTVVKTLAAEEAEAPTTTSQIKEETAALGS